MMQLAALATIHSMTPARGTMAGFDAPLLLVAAPALFGTICGLQIQGRLSDRFFARAVNLTLLGAGLAMVA